MYCNKCGRAVRYDDLFCSYCGNKLEHREYDSSYSEEVIINSSFTGQRENEQRHEAEKEKKEEKYPKLTIDSSEFVWGIHQFPNNEKKKIEDVVVDWQKLKFYDPNEASETETEKVQSSHTQTTEWKAEPQSIDVEESRIDNEKAAPPQETESMWSKAVRIAPDKTLTIEDIQKDIDRDNQQARRDTEKIDKFYTFNQKNEEFQKLLDREYERVNKGRGEDGIKEEELPFETATATPATPVEKVETAEPVEDITPQQEIPSERQQQQTVQTNQNTCGGEGMAEIMDNDSIIKRFDTLELEKDLLEISKEKKASKETPSPISLDREPIRITPDFHDMEERQNSETLSTDAAAMEEAMRIIDELYGQVSEEVHSQEPYIEVKAESPEEIQGSLMAKAPLPVMVEEDEKILAKEEHYSELIQNQMPLGAGQTLQNADILDKTDLTILEYFGLPEESLTVEGFFNESKNTFKEKQETVSDIFQDMTEKGSHDQIAEFFDKNYGDDDGKDEAKEGKSYEEKDDYTDYLEDEERSIKDKVITALKVILVIILVFEIALLGLRYFAPESQITKMINNSLGSLAGKITDSNKAKDNNTSGETDTQGNNPSEEVTIPTEAAPQALEALVFNAYSSNKNIKKIQGDSTLGYETNTNSSKASELAKTVPIENNLWYVDDLGQPVLIDQSVVNALVAFDSTWIDYVNTKDETVFSYLKKDSKAYKNCKDFTKAGLVKKEFLSLTIGEIRVGVNGYYVWAKEEIQTTENGKTTASTYKWIYNIEPVGQEMKIVDYYKF